MFQAGEVLETYRLQIPPERLSSQTNAAVKIFGHPLKFLTYEGIINNGKGTVQIEDSGTYQILSECENKRDILLDGKILKGKFAFELIEGDTWKFFHCPEI